jgi:8-oxo-dGTP diphosphatase
VATVVGAAILRVAGGGWRVLAAERSHPAALAGRWEFPGGKVEAGETDPEALVRECREELGIEVAVGERIGPDLPIPGGRVLRVFACRLLDGEPVPYEHRSLRWLAAGEVSDVPWLDTNTPLLTLLEGLLRAAP